MDDVLAAFGNLTIWRRGDRRAPHKPLLILLALGRWANWDRGPMPFTTIEEPLANLLGEFGPPRASSPEEPFWRLRRDGVWELGGTEHLPAPAAPDPPGLKLLRAGVTGQFSAPVRAALERSPDLVPRIARAVLDGHFPESLHPRHPGCRRPRPDSRTAPPRSPVPRRGPADLRRVLRRVRGRDAVRHDEGGDRGRGGARDVVPGGRTRPRDQRDGTLRPSPQGI